MRVYAAAPPLTPGRSAAWRKGKTPKGPGCSQPPAPVGATRPGSRRAPDERPTLLGVGDRPSVVPLQHVVAVLRRPPPPGRTP
jgi:hypothetical protein